jgi:hypothetical protein
MSGHFDGERKDLVVVRILDDDAAIDDPAYRAGYTTPAALRVLRVLDAELAAIDDPAVRAATATKILGRRWKAIINLVREQA